MEDRTQDFADLPEDIWARILNKLSDQDPPSMFSAACTCKAFNRHVPLADSPFWKVAFFGQRPPDVVWESEINKMIEYFGGYKRLVFARSPKYGEGSGESGTLPRSVFLSFVRTSQGHVLLWAGDQQDDEEKGKLDNRRCARNCELNPVHKDADMHQLIDTLVALKIADTSDKTPITTFNATASSWTTSVQLETFFWLGTEASQRLGYHVSEIGFHCGSSNSSIGGQHTAKVHDDASTNLKSFVHCSLVLKRRGAPRHAGKTTWGYVFFFPRSTIDLT